MDKKKLNILSTITIGLIGSASWELLLSPLIHKLIDLTIIFLINISVTFSNYYVANIAYASTQYISVGFRSMVWVIFTISLIYDFNLPKLKNLLPNWKVLKFILIFILSVDILVDIKIYSESQTFQNNVEIIAPYISDLEYKTIKSEFYLMENMDEYSSLKEKLNTIATDNGIKLK